MAKKSTLSKAAQLPVPVEMIERRIFLIRQQKVMLDSDLAGLYGVPTRALNQAVRRNPDRFPEDFMFRLNQHEVAELNRSQIVIGSQKHRDPRYPPYAFTDYGILMLSSVLKSKRAVAVNIAIMRAFVRLRQVLATHKDLARKMADLERQQHKQRKHIAEIFTYIQKLLEPPKHPKRPIGFQPPKYIT